MPEPFNPASRGHRRICHSLKQAIRLADKALKRGHDNFAVRAGAGQISNHMTPAARAVCDRLKRTGGGHIFATGQQMRHHRRPPCVKAADLQQNTFGCLKGRVIARHTFTNIAIKRPVAQAATRGADHILIRDQQAAHSAFRGCGQIDLHTSSRPLCGLCRCRARAQIIQQALARAPWPPEPIRLPIKAHTIVTQIVLKTGRAGAMCPDMQRHVHNLYKPFPMTGKAAPRRNRSGQIMTWLDERPLKGAISIQIVMIFSPISAGIHTLPRMNRATASGG